METDIEEKLPVSADLKDYVEIAHGLKWECIMCGSCCGDVFTSTWLEICVADIVGDPVDGFCKHLDREDENKCRIYDSRPSICRGYPFVIKKNGGHYVLTIHRRCNGIGHGEVLDIKKKLMEIIELVEDDLGVEFIVENVEENDFKLYKVK